LLLLGEEVVVEAVLVDWLACMDAGEA